MEFLQLLKYSTRCLISTAKETQLSQVVKYPSRYTSTTRAARFNSGNFEHHLCLCLTSSDNRNIHDNNTRSSTEMYRSANFAATLIFCQTQEQTTYNQKSRNNEGDAENLQNPSASRTTVVATKEDVRDQAAPEIKFAGNRYGFFPDLRIRNIGDSRKSTTDNLLQISSQDTELTKDEGMCLLK